MHVLVNLRKKGNRKVKSILGEFSQLKSGFCKSEFSHFSSENRIL